MAVMSLRSDALIRRSPSLDVAPTLGRARLLAPQALPVARRRARGGRRVSAWQWTLHAAVVALAGWSLGMGWAGTPRASDPSEGFEVRVLNSALPTDFALAYLPPLGPPVEDERPLVERIASYQVAPGDTLLDLAQRFGINTETLLWSNPLPDPDRILPGQGLTVLPVPGVLHTVGEGDTVAVLADRYGVSPQTLIEANGLLEPYALHAGGALLVPNGQPLQTAGSTVPWPAPGTGVRFKQQFIEAAAAPAREMQRRSGAPASVAIAQAIHETGWGSSRLAWEGHNYFGIKGRNSEGPAGVVWMNTWEVLGGRNVTVREPFRAYNTPDESFLDYGLFFIQNRRYHGALAVADDPRAFIQAIATAGFATDPVYAAKIIRLMDQYDLYRYDLPPTRVIPPNAGTPGAPG
jgi:LysM repeat protein